MTERIPHSTDRALAAAAARRAREAVALRDNLRRRKAQSRERETACMQSVDATKPKPNPGS